MKIEWFGVAKQIGYKGKLTGFDEIAALFVRLARWESGNLSSTHHPSATLKNYITKSNVPATMERAANKGNSTLCELHFPLQPFR